MLLSRDRVFAKGNDRSIYTALGLGCQDRSSLTDLFGSDTSNASIG